MKSNLKPLILILTLLVQIGFTQTRQDRVTNDLQGFNDFLGKEKATALDAAVKSFDSFLSLNYSGQEKTRKFLEDLNHQLDSLPNWKFDSKENSKVLKLLETSGMRKEIWIYGYESYDCHHCDGPFPWPNLDNDTLVSATDTLDSIILEDIEEEIIPIWRDELDSLERVKRIEEFERRNDSILNTNLSGQFLYGLAKYAPNDTSIQEFIDVTFFMGGMPSYVFVNANLRLLPDFEEPFYKRIIVAETYYHIFRRNAEKKQRHANNRYT